MNIIVERIVRFWKSIISTIEGLVHSLDFSISIASGFPMFRKVAVVSEKCTIGFPFSKDLKVQGDSASMILTLSKLWNFLDTVLYCNTWTLCTFIVYVHIVCAYIRCSVCSFIIIFFVTLNHSFLSSPIILISVFSVTISTRLEYPLLSLDLHRDYFVPEISPRETSATNILCEPRSL